MYKTLWQYLPYSYLVCCQPSTVFLVLLSDSFSNLLLFTRNLHLFHLFTRAISNINIKFLCFCCMGCGHMLHAASAHGLKHIVLQAAWIKAQFRLYFVVAAKCWLFGTNCYCFGGKVFWQILANKSALSFWLAASAQTLWRLLADEQINKWFWLALWAKLKIAALKLIFN